MTVSGLNSLKLRLCFSLSPEKAKKNSRFPCLVRKNSPRVDENSVPDSHLAGSGDVLKSGVPVLYPGWCQCISMSLSARAAAFPLKWALLHTPSLHTTPSLSLPTYSNEKEKKKEKLPQSNGFFSALRANYIKSLCSDLIGTAPPSWNQLFNTQSHTGTARAWGVLEWAYSTPRTPIISRAPCSQSRGFSARQMQSPLRAHARERVLLCARQVFIPYFSSNVIID